MPDRRGADSESGENGIQSRGSCSFLDMGGANQGRLKFHSLRSDDGVSCIILLFSFVSSGFG